MYCIAAQSFFWKKKKIGRSEFEALFEAKADDVITVDGKKWKRLLSKKCGICIEIVRITA